jgi:hypothetical protein
MKIRCSKCRQLAIWFYAPSFNGKVDSFNYYCDSCVSRGCSCNVDPDTNEECRDESGRLTPCCEYDYSELGYDDDRVLDDSDLYETDLDES